MKEVKTTTTYSSNQIKKFLEVYYFDKIKVVRLILNILILIMIIYFFTKSDFKYTDIISFIIAALGIIELNTTAIPSFNYYKMTKKKDNPIDTKVKYNFKETSFVLSTNKNETIYYKDLTKVIDTDIAYYLYINKERAFIVDKTALTKEEISFLTKTFKDKVSTYKTKK